MKNRIIKIIEEHQLSNSQFADKVGIPRSGLSHVLSGRNKVSLDYVLKITEAFPEVDPQWLLKGSVSTASVSAINTSMNIVNKKLGEQAGKMAKELLGDDGKKSPEKFQEEILKSAPNRLESDKNTIERIVVFYTNGKFKEYTP